jgi:hypothetical protein
LTPANHGFRKCYRHPAKVAIRDCRVCGRPICKEDEAESGEPDLCLVCKQDILLHGEQRLESARKPERQTPIVVGEVTVLDDGTVVKPEQPPLAALEAEVEVPPLAMPEIPPGEPPPLAVPKEEAAVPREVEEPVPAFGSKAKTGPWNQTLYASRYGLAIAALTAGAWMIIVLLSKQWTQVSVFTLGIAVPWAIFNATTRKKYVGIRVWTEPPPTIFMSLASFSITVVFSVLMEFLARLIIFGNQVPVSDFMQRYFKTTDWLVVACALAVSLLAPFLLKVGAEWSKPSSRRRGKGALPAAEAEELRKALEAEAQREPDVGQEPPAGIDPG